MNKARGILTAVVNRCIAEGSSVIVEIPTKRTRQDYLTEAATRKVRDHSTYGTDGRCHNAEPGTYGHECGRPAMWIGTTATGFRSGYCLTCRAQGFEARRVIAWESAQ